MFEDKLKERYEVNRKALDSAMDAFQSMFYKNRAGYTGNPSVIALSAVFRYLGLDESELESSLKECGSIKKFLKRKGVFCMHMRLQGKWWRDASGPVIAFDSDENPVAVIPGTFGYRLVDPKTGETRKLKARDAAGFHLKSYNFFRSLPHRKLSLREFLKFAAGAVSARDYLVVTVCCVVATLLSMLVPVANKIIYSEVVPSGLMEGILPICALLLGAGIGSSMFNFVRDIMVARMRDRINANVQPALFARLLVLPSSFFRTRSASDLSSRVLAAEEIYHLFTNQLMGVLTTGVFAVLYLMIAFLYAKCMVWVVTIVTVVYFLIYYILFKNFSEEYDKKIPNGVIAQEFTHGVMAGLHKIKNNRAEYRAYSQWARRYGKSEEITADTKLVLRVGKIIGWSFYSIANFTVWIIAWNENMAVSDFMAFMSAFGVMQTALSNLSAQVQNLAKAVPNVKLLTPILETEPEENAGRVEVSSITGGIDVNHVSFSYSGSSRKILNDVSLHIRPGENIGLVGPSGCGKSTLMRIMMGFEKPDSGSVFFGQYNLQNVNMGSLRQYVGYCPQAMQVFPGTIADNIRLAAPMSTDDEVWEAARIASLDEDIRKMPLQMDTLVGEGGSGLSGGQCQRLLIARAVINRPRVLFFDEATAALDNITQRRVVENLASFGCTRISIAHRLSTVMSCDRVIVMDKGAIIEDGSPRELIDRKGFFYKLSIRQQ